jgi:hypothetical protein
MRRVCRGGVSVHRQQSDGTLPQTGPGACNIAYIGIRDGGMLTLATFPVKRMTRPVEGRQTWPSVSDRPHRRLRTNRPTGLQFRGVCVLQEVSSRALSQLDLVERFAGSVPQCPNRLRKAVEAG